MKRNEKFPKWLFYVILLWCLFAALGIAYDSPTNNPFDGWIAFIDDVHAASIQHWHMKIAKSRVSAACSEGTGDIIYEGFETTSGTACQGFDMYGESGWNAPVCTTSGFTLDEDYDGSGLSGMPLCGSRHVYMHTDSGQGRAYFTFQKSSGVSLTTYSVIEFQINSENLDDNDSQMVLWFRNGGITALEMRIVQDGSGNLKLNPHVYHDSSLTDKGNSTTNLSTGTNYTLYMKYDYTGSAYEVKLDSETITSDAAASNMTTGINTYFVGPIGAADDEIEMAWDSFDVDSSAYVRSE